MEKKVIIGLCFIVLCACITSAASSETIEYPAQKASSTNAQFIVKVLKYEPFPVNPGDWFDIWVKIENIGEEDAPNLKAELLSDSVFEVQDPIQNYGIIPGIVSAYSYQQQLNDKNTEANLVLLKYHVFVDGTAPEGTDDIKLSISTSLASSSIIYDLPIDIKKTRTDFSVTLDAISPQGATFALSNIGDETAKALIVAAKDNNDVTFLQKYSPASIGDMVSGAVDTASLRIIPKENVNSITLDLSYTDSANVRTTLEKIIPVSKETIAASKTDFEVNLNELAPQETAVAVSNIGNFLAKSVTVSVMDENNIIFLENYAPVSLGDMSSGDIAIAHLRALPKENAGDLTLTISYTDDADVRRTVQKKIIVSEDMISALCPPSKDISYLFWVFGAVGFICGAFLVILAVLFMQQKGKLKGIQ
jgi:hypothetical protein